METGVTMPICNRAVVKYFRHKAADGFPLLRVACRGCCFFLILAVDCLVVILVLRSLSLYESIVWKEQLLDRASPCGLFENNAEVARSSRSKSAKCNAIMRETKANKERTNRESSHATQRERTKRLITLSLSLSLSLPTSLSSENETS